MSGFIPLTWVSETDILDNVHQIFMQPTSVNLLVG